MGRTGMGVRALLLGSAAGLAIAGQASAQSAGNSSDTAGGSAVEEVVVTATKRPEAVRKISGSVTAVTGDQLQKLGAEDMSGYLTRIPGVVFNASTPGNSTVVIRGVSTTTGIDQGQGTTGYFINDVPLTDPSYSIATPDIDTFDVDNVVVLRGPQGTLFGSSSLGGSVNYQAAAPELGVWRARVQGTVESVEHGDTGGSGKIMLNMPVAGDKFAIRGVYVYRDIAGYIDNLGTGETDANRTLIRGGRLEALWTPTPDTRISYLYLRQTENTADVGYESPTTVGPLQKFTVVPERANFGTLIHSLRADHDFGFATLTATATYHQKTQDTLQDYTPALGFLLPGVSPITIGQPARSTGTTFEVRLASPTGRKFEYLIGAMRDVTHENVANIAYGQGAANVIETLYGPIFGAGIGAVSAPDDVFLDAFIAGRGAETAAFGEATYHFNDQWKLTAGGRLFDQRITTETTSSGFYNVLTAGVLSSDVTGTQHAQGFAPKASLTWTPNSDVLAYALASKGFRFGGPNLIPPGNGVPAQYGSDSLWNYEIGVRTNLFDRRLLLDATAFYIDWSDIQLHLRTPTQLNYAVNGGAARIYGVEGTATLLLADGLRLSSNLTYLDAALADPFNPGGGLPTVPKGTALPGASRWQASNTLSYDWPVGTLHPNFVVSHRYISRASGDYFFGAPQGGYNLFDARIGVQVRDFEVTAFVANIGDVRGVTNGALSPEQVYLTRPRTIGITLDYRL